MPNATESRWIKIEAFGSLVLNNDEVCKVGKWIESFLSECLEVSDFFCEAQGGVFKLKAYLTLSDQKKFEGVDVAPIFNQVCNLVGGPCVVLYLSAPNGGLLQVLSGQETFHDPAGIQLSIANAYYQ